MPESTWRKFVMGIFRQPLHGETGMARDWRHQWALMGAAFATSAAIAVAVITASGVNPDSVARALRYTARFDYLLFWCAYTGSSLAVLFGDRFRPLARRGREFGLAFASAHTLHVLLVVWLYRISPEPPISNPLAVFFGVGLFWMYTLALFSISDVRNLIGARVWSGVRLVGLEYIQFAFLWDFVISPTSVKIAISYLPFAIFGIAGTVARLFALYRRRMVAPKPSITHGNITRTV